ncbi:saccharopine dehydrogenase family protein [Pseudomonas gingeri]|uniref:saccharopine dehydrogenase family protein n=1 Tax=Pseudomonas gingeri TaxID=117681 RepID=UPI0015A17C02|nr:saccharopine dehydrogenase NADP-binding domain-containing protein [Pseudomonas gingeri]NWD06557.1 saccharopine dehydrogenase NADP-binding domain-containing protein [Pseudomonas gingeri]NWE33163.1 saccharopine dehydrogenase NADP-binding domain-containing protein [Pseudomonas gingeri]NWE55500.1 saccharopine dehydrogenase NADP-binding domain-containing protein [Pseudomonas gingeri]NWF04011.1 saccharopine dehydrogenase NADP-binding domain-containing protein [Pseudomonas gingeri]
MRIIVIGGLGNFGARICRRLALEPGLELIAASRSAGAGSHTFDNGQTVATLRLDMDAADFAARLTDARPALVIHCAGPFQGQDYRVAMAACAAGAHYIDLADGRDFVDNFSTNVDTQAKAAGVLAVSGASSVPGLSSAVVDQLARSFSRLDGIGIAIAPGQQAPRGVATIQAVFGYAGMAFARWNGGAWVRQYGWQDIHSFNFAGLGRRWGAACDIPDLALFPARYAGVRDVEFHAALELRLEHIGLWLAAALRRLGMPLPISRFAAQLDALSRKVLDRFGSDTGAMMVRVRGLSEDNRPSSLTWQLTAPDGNGPEIPCMAAVLLACKLASGEITQVGALPCMGLLQLDEFEAEFRRWNFTSSLVENDL